MAILMVPASLAFLFGLLALAECLERRSTMYLVRSSLRSPLSCEETEAVVAANLAPYLDALGLGREADDDDEAPGEGAVVADDGHETPPVVAPSAAAPLVGGDAPSPAV